MADEVPEGLGRTEIEPAAMEVADRLTVSRTFWATPPAGNSANFIFFVRNTLRCDDPVHNIVVGAASSRPAKFSLVGLDDGPHRGHCGLVLLRNRMFFHP